MASSSSSTRVDSCSVCYAPRLLLRDAAIPGHPSRSSVPVVRCRPRPLPDEHARQHCKHQEHHRRQAPVVGRDFGECAGQRRQRERCGQEWQLFAPKWAPSLPLQQAPGLAPGVPARCRHLHLHLGCSAGVQLQVQVSHPKPRPPEPAPRDSGPRAIGPDRPRRSLVSASRAFPRRWRGPPRSSRAGPAANGATAGWPTVSSPPIAAWRADVICGSARGATSVPMPKAYRWPPTPRLPPVGPGGRRC